MRPRLAPLTILFSLTASVTLLLAASPAVALSCIGRPDGFEELTITGGEVDDWYRELEVPVVIGEVIEGTPADLDHNAAAGERLAKIRVIAGLRLDEIGSELEVVTDDLTGWGFPSYAVGDFVFLRIEEEQSIERYQDGPCSLNGRFTQVETDGFLALAEANKVPIVFPAIEEPTTTVPGTTTTAPADPTTTLGTAPVPPPADDDDDGISSAVVILGVVVVLVGVAGVGYGVSRRR